MSEIVTHLRQGDDDRAGAPHESASKERGQNGSRTIQSVERAFDLIDIMAEAGHELHLHEIADRAGLNNSTCHHLLATLVKRGYACRSPRNRTYSLGSRVTELSNARLKQISLVDIAMPFLKEFNRTTREAVHLTMMQGHSLVTLAKLDSPMAIRVGTDNIVIAGAAHATACGKAILAWLPEAEMARIIAENGLQRFTESTIVLLADLIEDLRLTRRRGYALDNEEFQAGVVCFGAAIRDLAGGVIGSVSCSMPAMRAEGRHREDAKAAVQRCATEISEKFGAA